MYEVTITNITSGQTFTPILVASHKKSVNLFTLGTAASQELEELAEGGATGPLAAVLMSNSKVKDVTDSGALLGPGQSVMIEVSAKKASRISVAAMLVPTNDTFMALNNAKAPKQGSITYQVGAYDAGSEPNDELCASIPGGGGCAGEGFSAANGEGFVHISSGIHGIGDLAPEAYDWRNPVASITIKRKH